MKFRWKILILLLAISIVPVVSLRTFGIHNVRRMAEALLFQVKGKQIDDAEHRLQLLLKDYAKAVRTTREQVEMALFYQTMEAERLLKTQWPEPNQSKSLRASDLPDTAADEIIDNRCMASIDSGINADEKMPGSARLCFSIPRTLDAARAKLDIQGLKRMWPVYQSASQYLGDLVLRQHLGLQNGLFSVYPCNREIPPMAAADKQNWYQSAFEEKASAWSRPFKDPLSGHSVMAVSYPVMREDESVVGVTSILVPLDSLLEQVYLISGLPAGVRPYLCTLAFKAPAGEVGVKILAPEQQPPKGAGAHETGPAPRWLDSSDRRQFRAMLEDIARRQYRIREMPFNGQPSFWAYGPLLHQGSAFVFIVPHAEMLPENNPILESIRNRVTRVERYTAGFLIFLVLAVAVLALTFSRTVTRPLRALSRAAQKLARGDFNAAVSVTSKDEFGDVGHMFNSIGPRLKEHYRMQQSLEVAQQIQQNLLPSQPPEIQGLEIFGMTLFSDETGGDYFDYLCVDEAQKEKLCVVVGDVAGHGIPSALFMATVRGFLRLRATIPGTLGDIASDINREFAKDAENSGQFMTMFLARIDRGANRIDWVRAGHDPAILYDPDTDSFRMLDKGRGLPLGVAADTVYEATSGNIKPGQILVMGTDGVWEARDAEGKFFGKQRLQRVVQANFKESARAILLSVLDAVETFRDKQLREDDLTLVVVKITDR